MDPLGQDHEWNGIMVKAITLSVCILVASSLDGHAGCEKRPLGETSNSYLNALLSRMRSTGVSDTSMATLAGAARFHIMLGSDVRVTTTEDGGLLSENGTVLSEPVTKADTDRQLTLAAFTLARYSGEPEQTIKTGLYRSLQQPRSQQAGSSAGATQLPRSQRTTAAW
jgi:hypothetical protein